jgi:putative intracellular protease/amidase
MTRSSGQIDGGLPVDADVPVGAERRAAMQERRLRGNPARQAIAELAHDQRTGAMTRSGGGVYIDMGRYIARAVVFTRREILRAGNSFLSRACPRRWEREMTQNRDE